MKRVSLQQQVLYYIHDHVQNINGFKKDSMCGNDFNIYRASAVERLSESLQNNKIKISLETQESIFRDCKLNFILFEFAKKGQ